MSVARQETLFPNDTIGIKRELYKSVRAFSPKEDSARILSEFQQLVKGFAKQATETKDFDPYVDYEKTFPGIGIDLNLFLERVLTPVLPDKTAPDGQLKYDDRISYIKRKIAEETEWVYVLTIIQRDEITDTIGVDVDWGAFMARTETDSDTSSTSSDDYFEFTDRFNNKVVFKPIIISREGRAVISVAIPELKEEGFYDDEDIDEDDTGQEDIDTSPL